MTRHHYLLLAALDRLLLADQGPWRAARVLLLSAGPLALFFAIGQPA